MLLLFRLSGGTPPVGIDLRDCFEGIYWTLNAASAADLVWWTDEELYAWLDQAAKSLARNSGSFIDRDATLTVIAGSAVYDLPARHVSTIHASVGYRSLIPTNVQSLEAKDAGWPESAELIASPLPINFLQDADGLEKIRVYKIPGPTANAALGLVIHRFPATITQATATVPLPSPLLEYFTFFALGEARSKESKGAMPEVGEWYRQLAATLETVAIDYYGGAQ